MITYRAEGRSYDLSVSFPLIRLRRHDVVPETLDDFVIIQRLREFMARAKYGLQDKYSLIPIPVSQN